MTSRLNPVSSLLQYRMHMPQAPSGQVNRLSVAANTATTLLSSISSLQTASSSIAKKTCCGFISSVCEKVSEVVRKIFNCIFSSVKSVWDYLTKPCKPKPPVGPVINTDLTNEKLEKVYWGLGRGNKWRECIDGAHHRYGREAYDRGLHGGTVEPGFIGSMERAFEYVANSLNRKIDAVWYLQLHKHTAAHFTGNNGTLMGQEKVGVFRNSDDGIQASFSGVYQVSPEALSEFNALDRQLQREFGSEFGLGEFVNTEPGTMVLKYKKMTRPQVERIFNKFLNEFYEEIRVAGTQDSKLLAIARLQQRLEWLHPVRDGTARTTTALLNKHLTEYGFHPAILEYPHVSSSYGLTKWKDYLQNGLLKWEQEQRRINP